MGGRFSRNARTGDLRGQRSIVANQRQELEKGTPSAAYLRRWAKIAIRVAVAAGLLGYLFSLIPVSQVLKTLATIDAGYIAVVFLIALGVQVLISLRLRLIAGQQGIRVSLARALDINLAAMFYGLFVPGGNLSRGAIRAYKLSRPSGRLMAAAASIVFDRLVATVALGVVGQIFWLLDRPWATVPIGLTFFIIWAGPISAYQILRFEGPITNAKRWLDRLGAIQARLPRLTKLRDSIHRFRRLSLNSLSIVLAASISAQLLSCIVYYLLAAGLGIEVSFVQMAWISTATTLLTMVPISPSGIGVREGVLVLFLSEYNVPGASALALSFLVFICTILLVGLLGGLLELRSWIGAEAPDKDAV